MFKTRLQSGGVSTTTTAVPPANAAFPDPSGFIQLLDWEGDERGLDLEFDVRAPSTPQVFPVGASLGSSNVSFNAGYNDGTSAWNNTPIVVDGPCGVLKLELLNSASERTIYIDMRSGRWSIGSCRKVRVSYTFWGTGVTVSDVVITGTVVPAGHLSPRPRFTAVRAFTAPSLFGIGAPPGAVNYDVYALDASVFGGGSAPIIYSTNAGAQAISPIYRDYSTGVYMPPYRVPISYRDVINIACVANDANIAVQFEVA